MTAEDFIKRLDGAKQTRHGWIARCPAHEDSSPSLSVCEGEDGRIVLHDFGGCEPSSVCAALGLAIRDLFAGNELSSHDVERMRREREVKQIRANRECECDGFTIDACREADNFVRSRRGIDTSNWSDEKLNDELNALADAYFILRCEDLFYG